MKSRSLAFPHRWKNHLEVDRTRPSQTSLKPANDNQQRSCMGRVFSQTIRAVVQDPKIDNARCLGEEAGSCKLSMSSIVFDPNRTPLSSS